MNKVWRKKKIIFSSLFSLCLILFNISCGLDTYIVMEIPVYTQHIPEANANSSILFNESYFEFMTNEDNNYSEGFKYLGTDVYYKIYNNYDTMKSEQGVLESYASDTVNSSKAPDKLINPVSSGGYGFKQLKATNVNTTPLIPATDNDKNVKIRLTDYQSDPEYSARITVDGAPLNNSPNKTVPMRFDNKYGFNFGRTETTKVPVSDDDDVKYGRFTDSNEKIWYVMMFAVGTGIDVNYTNYYSNIVYLGSVSINSDSIDN